MPGMLPPALNPAAVNMAREQAAGTQPGMPPPGLAGQPPAGIPAPGGMPPPGGMTQSQFGGMPKTPEQRMREKAMLIQKLRQLAAEEAAQGADPAMAPAQ